MRRLAQRLALLLGSTLLTLVVLEIVLRFASGFVERERGGQRGEVTILCVGDSHTFGLHVPEALSYPAQLQNRLDPSGSHIGVVNYGVPGRNSAALRRALPAYLDEIHPDLVLILIGFNDSWNVDGTTDEPTAHDEEGYLASLRIVRLFRLARLNVRGHAPAAAPKVYERDGKMMVLENGMERPAAIGGSAFGVLSGAALTAQVTKNLDAIVAEVKSHGAKPVLLTYATENQSYFLELNENARRFAMEHALPLVECAIPMRDPIRADGYAAWFSSDDHPNDRGNQRVAEWVAAELERQGLVKSTGASAEVLLVKPILEATGSQGTRRTLKIQGAADRSFHVAFSGATDPPSQILGATIPLAPDPILARCIENLNLRGHTDPGGRATIDCDLALLGAEPGQKLFASVVIFPLGGSAPIASDPIEITPR